MDPMTIQVADAQGVIRPPIRGIRAPTRGSRAWRARLRVVPQCAARGGAWWAAARVAPSLGRTLGMLGMLGVCAAILPKAQAGYCSFSRWMRACPLVAVFSASSLGDSPGGTDGFGEGLTQSRGSAVKKMRARGLSDRARTMWQREV
jgi:hypothetical protein